MAIEQVLGFASSRAEAHELEAAAFEAEVERGRDIFESSCALKYHLGCADAFREVGEKLEELLSPVDPDAGQPRSLRHDVAASLLKLTEPRFEANPPKPR